MSLLRRLLLLPLLAPLLAVLLVGAVNPRPAVRLRLLIWTSPPLPVGVWMLLAGTGGALLSGGATALALRGQERSLQRQVFREVWDEPEPRRSPAAAPPAATAPAAAAPSPPWAGSAAGPSRAPGEPSPTVAVAYRVIRRPAVTVAAAGASSASARPASAPPASSAGENFDDGWGALPGEEW